MMSPTKQKMKKISNQRKKELLRQVIWDYNRLKSIREREIKGKMSKAVEELQGEIH